MANTTNLTAACGLNDQVITVAATTGFAVGNLITVDGEVMSQSAAASGLVVPVRRGGQNGTAQVAHNSLAPVTAGLPSEAPLASPGQVLNRPPHAPVIVSYGADGAITPPAVNTIILLTKGSVATMTMAAPGAATPDGTEVTIMTMTAFAHTVAIFSKTATFTAAAGDNFQIIAIRGLWSQLGGTSGVAIA